MNVTEINDPGRIAPLAEEWDALLARSRNNTAFLSAAWITACLRNLGGGHTPFVLAVRDDGGRLRGVAPFTLHRCRIVLRRVVLEIAGQRLSYHGGVIADPDVAGEVNAAVARHVFQQGRRWDLVRFVHLAPDPSLASAFRTGAAAAGCRWAEGREDPCKAIRLPARFDDYLAGIDRSMSKRVGYCRRSLFRDHSVDLVEAVDDASFDSLWTTFLALHRDRIESTGRTTVLARPDVQGFYRDVAGAALARRTLRLVGLRMDGEVVAVLFGIVHGGAFNFVNIGFKEYSKYSLGLLLPVLCIERSIGEGLEWFDFLGGGGAYKSQLGGTDLGGGTLSVVKPVVVPELRLREAVRALWHACRRGGRTT